MTIRATVSALMSTTGLGSPSRISGSYLVSTLGLHDRIRISTAAAATTLDLSGDIRVTSTYMMVLADIHSAIYPRLLDSTSVIYPPEGFDVIQTVPPTPEPNPYRATIPESIIAADAEAYDFTPREPRDSARAAQSDSSGRHHLSVAASDSTARRKTL